MSGWRSVWVPKRSPKGSSRLLAQPDAGAGVRSFGKEFDAGCLERIAQLGGGVGIAARGLGLEAGDRRGGHARARGELAYRQPQRRARHPALRRRQHCCTRVITVI